MALAVATLLCTPFSQADLRNLQGLYASDLEASVAFTLQDNYDAFISQGCSDQQVSDSESCGGAAFQSFRILRRLVHTANDLLPEGGGATQFSMRLNIDLLNEALRWVAAEEHIEQGDLSGDFVEGQFTGLVGRLNALRFGAAGFSLSGIQYSDPRNGGATGYWGGAAGDPGAGFSRLSGFINVQLSRGNQDPSGREDAFDFDGTQVNGGVDYRLNERWVVGTTLGYAKQNITFDRSQSVAEGEVATDGLSVMPFVLYNADKVFASVALGWQSIALDSDRVIRYASNNPAVESTDTRALSNTDANSFSLYTTLGYAFRSGAFSLEPYTEYRFVDISIDGFRETDIANQSHNLQVNDQSLSSSELAFGVNTQYVLSSSFGVWVPFFDVQLRREMDDTSNVVRARYAGAVQDFNFAANRVDTEYLVYTLGVSSVLRGARQGAADSAAGGGLSVFANYRSYVGIENLNYHTIAAGLRYEF